MKYLNYGIILLLFACNYSNKNKSKTIRKDNMIIKGNILSDSIFNDTIYYYDLNNRLLSKKFYFNGRQDGISIEYFPNGKPMMISNYSNGLKNGYNYYFDSTGRCYYKDYYYYNLPVGPVLYYDSTSSPKGFYFINLQNETLVRIDYNAWNGISSIVDNCINFTSNMSATDSSSELSVLLYLIKLPKFSFKYKLLKRKIEDESNLNEVMKIESDSPFTRFTLPILPSDELYTIGLEVYDSINRKQSVIYKDL